GAAAGLAVEADRRVRADRHGGHRAGLDRIGHDQVDVVGDRSDHVQRDDRDPDFAQFLGGRRNVATHDRARQDEQPGARQVGDGPYRGRDIGLTDERDRVDRDALAAQVVAVGLAHGTQRDLGDLCAATDHDDPLAEHRPEGARPMYRAHIVDRFERRDELVLADALDLELDLDEWRVIREWPDGRQRSDAAAERRYGGPDRRCG